MALIKAEGRKAVALPAYLRDPAICAKRVADAVAGLGGLDIVVNNAARQQTKASILDISNDEFDWTIKTNVYAPFWIIKAALSHLKPGAVIIGSTSEQAKNPSADLYDYAQTKAATTNYVLSLAKQLGKNGIRVNDVDPGPEVVAAPPFCHRGNGFRLPLGFGVFSQVFQFQPVDGRHREVDVGRAGFRGGPYPHARFFVFETALRIRFRMHLDRRDRRLPTERAQHSE